MTESSRMPLFDLRKLNSSLPVPSVKDSALKIHVVGAENDFIVVKIQPYKTHNSLPYHLTGQSKCNTTMIFLLTISWFFMPLLTQQCSSSSSSSISEKQSEFLQDMEGLQETGRFYGVSPVCLPGLAHDIMLDTSWEKGAESILSWVDGLR